MAGRTARDITAGIGAITAPTTGADTAVGDGGGGRALTAEPPASTLSILAGFIDDIFSMSPRWRLPSSDWGSSIAVLAGPPDQAQCATPTTVAASIAAPGAGERGSISAKPSLASRARVSCAHHRGFSRLLPISGHPSFGSLEEKRRAPLSKDGRKGRSCAGHGRLPRKARGHASESHAGQWSGVTDCDQSIQSS